MAFETDHEEKKTINKNKWRETEKLSGQPGERSEMDGWKKNGEIK